PTRIGVAGGVGAGAHTGRTDASRTGGARTAGFGGLARGGRRGCAHRHGGLLRLLPGLRGAQRRAAPCRRLRARRPPPRRRGPSAARVGGLVAVGGGATSGGLSWGSARGALPILGQVGAPAGFAPWGKGNATATTPKGRRPAHRQRPADAVAP